MQGLCVGQGEGGWYFKERGPDQLTTCRGRLGASGTSKVVPAALFRVEVCDCVWLVLL